MNPVRGESDGFPSKKRLIPIANQRYHMNITRRSTMPDILIRNLDEQAFKRLKQRAKRNRRSLQNEAKLVLQQAVSL